MNAWHPPSQLRLWAARFLAGLGAVFAVAPGFFSRSIDHQYASVLRLPVDALAIWLAGKRRYRFTAAVWFGCSALFYLLSAVDHGPLQGWLFAAALPLTLAAALLVWPLLRAPSEQARLAPLSGVWVLVATLVMTATDATLIRGFASLSRDTVAVAGLSALGLFAGCMISSHFGPLRWLGQLGTVAIIALAQFSDLRDLSAGALAAMDLAKLVTWLGLATFAVGLDWIRAGMDSRTRFLRAGALALGATLAPLALAALWSPLRLEVVAMAVARAAAFGLTAAIMPRVGGRAESGVRRASAMGRPPWALLGFIGALAAVWMIVLSSEKESVVLWMLVAMVPVLLFLVIRTRITRAALFLVTSLPLMITALAYERHGSGVSLLALAAGALCSVWLSGPKTGKHFQRRFRWAGVPHPRVSLALAGAAAAAFLGPLVFTSVTQPASRSGLLAAAGGPIPLPEPLYFRDNPIPRDAPSPGRLTGSTVAVDPLGRGTWVVDEERDEVTLVASDKQVKRFPVGEWPELLVVTREGRVFVSCREAARIDVIEPDFQRQTIGVGDEVRGLALDPSERRLYAGLLLTRALESFDTRTLGRVGHLDLPSDPRSVAVTAAGVAALPDRGSALEMASADLRHHWSLELPSGEGVAWHGQALLPAGRDLLVLHAQVNTGLDHPVSGGGYGGAVSQPVNLVATLIEDGRAPLVPPNARNRASALNLPDVSGAALGDDGLYLASRIDGSLERIPYWHGLLDPSRRSAMDLLNDGFHPSDEPDFERLGSGNGLTGVALEGDRVVTFAAFDRVLVAAPKQVTRDGSPLEVKLGTGHLDAQLALGRQLFFRNDGTISGAKLACASCHTDGREDGLVWRLQGGRLQTPSLAGRVADTAPYNWHGTTRSLPDNITQTIDRLGGSGLPKGDREALARYLTRGLRPVLEAPSGDPAAVARGRALFHDRTVGCSSCHDPDSAFTDGQPHDVESLSAKEREELKASGKPVEATAGAFDTPTLRQVGLTAPYFHDGSARSLEEVVERNGDRMGKTSQLSADERRALVAYLRTL